MAIGVENINSAIGFAFIVVSAQADIALGVIDGPFAIRNSRAELTFEANNSDIVPAYELSIAHPFLRIDIAEEACGVHCFLAVGGLHIRKMKA
ncbi:TPA: hypothetical protein L6A33_01320 [Pseudomonas aeruginosa]|nr:hypothetical protein [Pseudomonas aeruginosa]